MEGTGGIDLTLSGVGTTSSCTEGINRVPRAIQEIWVTTGHTESSWGKSGKAMGSGHGAWVGNLTRHAAKAAGAEDRTGVAAWNRIIERAEDSTTGLREPDPEWWVKGP